MSSSVLCYQFNFWKVFWKAQHFEEVIFAVISYVGVRDFFRGISQLTQVFCLLDQCCEFFGILVHIFTLYLSVTYGYPQ